MTSSRFLAIPTTWRSICLSFCWGMSFSGPTNSHTHWRRWITTSMLAITAWKSTWILSGTRDCPSRVYTKMIGFINVELPTKKMKLETNVCPENSSDTHKILFDDIISNNIINARFDDFSKLTFLPLIDCKDRKKARDKHSLQTAFFQRFFDVHTLIG